MRPNNPPALVATRVGPRAAPGAARGLAAKIEDSYGCGKYLGNDPNRAVAYSLVTHYYSHLRSLRGCWIVEALKASGVTLSNFLPQKLADQLTNAFWYLLS